ncbi:MAG: hypothetical protein U5O39_10775 [Gammaproteobacteria bacterium]|nr:hypothetical protein [Gammaproteobacteria bacterium]
MEIVCLRPTCWCGTEPRSDFDETFTIRDFSTALIEANLQPMAVKDRGRVSATRSTGCQRNGM